MRMWLRAEACLRAAVWRDLGTTDCPVSLYSIILILIIGRTAYARNIDAAWPEISAAPGQ